MAWRAECMGGSRVDLPTAPAAEGRMGVIWQGPRWQAPGILRLCLPGAVSIGYHVSSHGSCVSLRCESTLNVLRECPELNSP